MGKNRKFIIWLWVLVLLLPLAYAQEVTLASYNYTISSTPFTQQEYIGIKNIYNTSVSVDILTKSNYSVVAICQNGKSYCMNKTTLQPNETTLIVVKTSLSKKLKTQLTHQVKMGDIIYNIKIIANPNKDNIITDMSIYFNISETKTILLILIIVVGGIYYVTSKN